MPTLHFQAATQQKTTDGRVTVVSPAFSLQEIGPLVQVTVSLQQSYARTMTADGKSVSPPVTGFALFDTGASRTCIDDETAERLRLPIIDVETMSSASHSNHESNIYPIQFSITGLPIQLQAPRAMGATLKHQGAILLIGRDLFAHCTMFYNGPAGQITLSI